MARVITVTSGRAGVGKTSICAQLATQLARRGQRVCLLDADGSGVNAGELLGLEPRHTLKDLVLYGVALDELLMHSCRGFDVLPGGPSSDWMQALTSAQLHQLTASLRQLDSYDFLLIDSAITAAHNVLSIAQTSPEVILVITPLAISVPDAYSLLNLLFSEHPTKRIQVVVNKVDNHIVGRHSYGGYRDVARRYLGRQLPLLGLVGEDPHIQAGLRKQQPAGNGQAAAVARDIGALADQLLAEKIVLPERNMQRFCDRYFKAAAVKDAGQTATAELLEIPVSRKQKLQREVEYLTSQVDDLIKEIDRLRQSPEGAQRAPLPETPIASLASDSQAVTVQGETFSIYSMQSSDGGRQYFAWHSLDDAAEASQPRAEESD
jgi:flagellar biosynthesis protein FlhG